jgi:glycogen(starch) synthase
MRICLYSNAYAPQCGGIETVSASLARGWQAAGHTVLVVSDTPAPPGFDSSSPFPVLRHPTWADWRRIAREYELVVSNGFALRHLLKWLVSGVRFWWIHQMIVAWRYPADTPWHRKLRWGSRRIIRPALARLARGGNVFISQAIRADVATVDGPVIYNPIATHFRPMPEVPRAADFGFFGRMWLPKGQDVLLRALAQCRDAGHRFTLDLYGDGEHLERIRQVASDLKLDDTVRFVSAVGGEELVRAMNSVGVIVVPSTWEEPMGVVAVEAMACGKCVIGSNKGGLGEVLNGWMPTFDNGSVEQLRDLMIRLGTSAAERTVYEAVACKRAADFSLEKVAAQYVSLFQGRLNGAR